MNRDRSPPHMPPDWAPPEFDTPEDIARSNRFVATLVLSVLSAGAAICLSIVVLLR